MYHPLFIRVFVFLLQEFGIYSELSCFYGIINLISKGDEKWMVKNKWSLKIKNNKYLPFLIILITSVCMFFLIIGNVKENTYDIRYMNLAPETIRAVKTMEDPVKTEEERERAASEVTPVYQYQEETAENQATITESIFDAAIEVKQKPINQEEEAGVRLAIEELKKELKALEDNEHYVRLSDESLRVLLSQYVSSLRDVRDNLTPIIEESLSKPIRSEDLSSEREKVVQEVRNTFQYPESFMNVIVTISRNVIVATEVINEEATNQRIEQAKASVEPTRILQGQILVQKGEIVSKEVYRQLELLGMLSDDKETYKPYIGLGLFVLLTMWVLFSQTISKEENNREKIKNIIVISFSLILSVLIMKVIQSIAYNFDVLIAFVFPTALVSMLVYSLVNERAAFITSFIVAAYAGIIFQEGYTNIFQMEVSLYILFGCIAGIFAMQQMYNNTQILRTSLIVSAVNVLFIIFYLLTTKTTYEFLDIVFYVGAALCSGILSGALTIGILPFLESAFGMLSAMRIIELSNPNHPLLKKILTETPGTYHHSLMVANLAEAACEVIGANGLLARVGCYYHDIGKTNRPGFFIENQLNGYNPHDNLSPESSRDIIIAHAVEGAEILRKNKLPKEIVDIAEQHHGTTLLKFFYHKAKELNPNVREEDYRYPGPKPQTKEAAIISIADSVEAAVRSMKEPDAKKIQQVIQAIMKDKLLDGQFDECNLSLKELKLIEESFCSTMNGTFHSRIEYPK